MSLTADEKAQVRDLLGYPDPGNCPSDELDRKMDNVSASGETIIRQILTTWATLTVKIDGQACTAGISEIVGELKFNSADGYQALNAQKQNLAERLARLLCIDAIGGGSRWGASCTV